MEEEKQLLQELRGYFALVKDRVDLLKEKGVELTIEIGTSSKTVLFEKVTLMETTIKAKIQQEL